MHLEVKEGRGGYLSKLAREQLAGKRMVIKDKLKGTYTGIKGALRESQTFGMGEAGFQKNVIIYMMIIYDNRCSTKF